MKTLRFGLLITIASIVALMSPQAVYADEAVFRESITRLAQSVCDGDQRCVSAFVPTALGCAAYGSNVTGALAADCILNTPSLEVYDLEGKRTEISQGIESAYGDASEVENTDPNIGPCSSTLLGFPAWNNGLQCDDAGPQINRLNDIWIIVLNMVRWLLAVAAYGAAIFVIWGGFKYIKSQGDPSSVANAKTTITQAIGGLFIALIASALVWFVQGLIS